MSASKLGEQRIIIGMPAYNEERNVASVVLLAQQYADEVIVLDDGSTDRTSKVAKLAGATVIRHSENKGYGAAAQTIMTEARKRDPDVLVFIDADAQHNPDEIPSLVKAISQGFDVVIGSRRIGENPIPGYRRVGQKVLSYFGNVLSGRKLSDTESGFRAFSRKALTEITLKEQGMAACAEAISVASAKGLKITEIPVSVVYTRDGSTYNPIRHGATVLHRIMVMISERRPILFFGLCGGISIALGLIAGVMVIKTYYASYLLATGTALVSMLLITIGMLSIFTGIILSVLVKRMSNRL